MCNYVVGSRNYLICSFCLMYRFGIGEPNYDEFTLAKSIVFAFCSLTMRGWSHVPHNLSTKIILFTYVQNLIDNYTYHLVNPVFVSREN